eukprot:jgi/Psemu1/60791/gm1.60791_g
MTTRTHKKRTSPDNDSHAARMKNHNGSSLPKKRSKSPFPLNGLPIFITQDNVSEEAFQKVAKTNGEPGVLTQVDDSEEASQTATTTNGELGVQPVPQRGATKDPAAHPKANPRQRKHLPAALVSSPDLSQTSPSSTNTKMVASLSEEDLDYQQHRRSTEKNLGSALNGQAYANTELVKALSSDVSTSFTQLMTKGYTVSKIIQSEPMPNFRKKLSTEYLAKNKKKERLLSTLGHMVNLFLCETDIIVAGKLGVLSTNEITNQFKDYEMISKRDNFQHVLWHVHGGREVGDARPHLYGCNVVNYKTIMKYMLVVHRKIITWYMENVEYPLAPENMEQSLCFYTKRDNGLSHSSRDYVAIMKQLLDDLIAKLALRVSMSQSYNQITLDKYFKSKLVDCLESLTSNMIEFVSWVESKDYVSNKLMNSTEPRTVFWFHQAGNITSTSQVLLPIHLPSVFHFVFHYRDLVMNFYHIHFDLNKNIVTLSPSKSGKGKIRLALVTVTEGIIYLVKEWLIRKMVDWEKTLLAEETTSFEIACNEYISQLLCASKLAENIAVADSFDNSSKAICQKVLKTPHTRSFGLKDVMQTIEDLSMFADEEYEGFQHDDCLYIYPPLGCGVDTQCLNFRFDLKPILMEHILYVFQHEIFVTDPEVLYNNCLDEWLSTLIHPAEMLVDQPDELFMAKLEVVFLSRTNMQNIDARGILSGVFKHLKGSSFKKYHTLADFQTWDCFVDSKDNWKLSRNPTGWVMFTSKCADSFKNNVSDTDSLNKSPSLLLSQHACH